MSIGYKHPIDILIIRQFRVSPSFHEGRKASGSMPFRSFFRAMIILMEKAAKKSSLSSCVRSFVSDSISLNISSRQKKVKRCETQTSFSARTTVVAKHERYFSAGHSRPDHSTVRELSHSRSLIIGTGKKVFKRGLLIAVAM